jgi:Big-like domain-containing protein
MRLRTTRLGPALIVLAVAACGPLLDPAGPSAANRAPEIRAVTLSPPVVTIGGTATVAVDAIDADGDTLYYRYTATAGTLSVPDPSRPNQAVYTHDGGADAADVVVVSVTDPRNASASARAQLRLLTNTAPSVVVRSSGSCHPTCTITFSADAIDGEGDSLTYSWRGCASGTRSTATCEVTAPARVNAVVVVSDGRGGVTTASAEAEGVNRSPNVGGGSDVSGTPVLLHPSAFDPDEDDIVCGWSGDCRCTGNQRNNDIECDAPPGLETCTMLFRCVDPFGALAETRFRVSR